MKSTFMILKLLSSCFVTVAEICALLLFFQVECKSGDRLRRSNPLGRSNNLPFESTTTEDLLQIATNSSLATTTTETTTEWTTMEGGLFEGSTTYESSEATTESSTTQDPCQTGYQEVNGTCEDIDECIVERNLCPMMLCKNIPGGYIRVCPKGYFRRTVNIWSGETDLGGSEIPRNNIVAFPSSTTTCFCATIISQRFGFPYSQSLSNTSSPEYQNMTSLLTQRLMHSYQVTPYGFYVLGIHAVKLTKGSVILTYEVLTSEQLTLPIFKKMYNITIDTNFWNSLQGLPGIVVDAPMSVSPLCVGDTFQSRKVVGRTYSFPNAEIHTIQRSQETCSSPGYYALIECALLDVEEGEPIGYYDTETLIEYFCDKSASEIVNEDTNYTSYTLELTIGALSSISSNMADDGVKNIVNALDVLQKAAEKDDIDITKNTMMYLLSIVDDIYDAVQMDYTNGVATLSNEDKMSFAKTLEMFASNLVMNDDELTVTSNSNVFTAQKIKCSKNASSAITFNQTISDRTRTFQPNVHSVIPDSAFPNSCNETAFAVFYLHKDGTLFPSLTRTKTTLNQVFSSQITRTKLSQLSEPISHKFGQPKRETGQKRDFITHRCAYLDLSDGGWKYDGCQTSVTDSITTTCDCDHTTNFAVLVQTHAVAGSYAINIASYVGCSCSIAGLTFVLIIYLSIKKLRVSQINQIHIHLSICLLVAYLTFIIGVERPRSYIPCMIVGGILQFSFLSAWGWMFAESITMYRKFVYIFSHMSSNYVMKASFIVYILSLLATGLTIIVAYVTGDMMQYEGWSTAADNDPQFHPSFYVSDRLCWLHGYSLYFGFLTPVGIMFIGNIFGFINIIRVLTKSNSELRSTKIQKNETKDHAYRIFMVSILLGITWIFAVPLTITDDAIVNEVFGWLFSLSNAFQGLFIFLLFCVKRKDVRTLWTKYLPQINLRKSSVYDVHNATSTASTGVGTQSQTDGPTLNHSTALTYKNMQNLDESPSNKTNNTQDPKSTKYSADESAQQDDPTIDPSLMTEIHLSPLKSNPDYST
uniref:adhesion G-protein coupled receptor G7-like isoform X1 n=1 Tax=Styela clava TaxID=7725 RepID=UPI0019398D8E|nr:adhesion G-protein coupled receptor G7-like isoform X1 [Styela clava]